MTVAAALLTAGISATAMTLFLFGCCVLPFHRYVHRIMPLCGGIVGVLSHKAHPDAATPAVPPRTAAAPRTILAAQASLSDDLGHGRLLGPSGTAMYRNFLTLGALRCDDDVGLHLLLATLII